MIDYSTRLALGMAGGAVLAAWMARYRRIDLTQIWDLILAAALNGLLAARLAYVAVNWAYYADHVPRAFHLSDGGLSWHGGLVGALLAATIYCCVRRLPLGATVDCLTPGAALMAAAAWLGCFSVGCAYGIETYPGQGWLWRLSMDLPDLYGLSAPRVPVQLLGAGWGVLGLGLILLVRRRSLLRGLLFPLWLALYAGGSFFLTGLRADEALMVAGWRLDRWVDLVFTAGAGLVLARGLSQRLLVEQGGHG